MDCVLFAADCVLASTGEDPASDVRGSWESGREARALLRRVGGLAAVASSRLGVEIDPSMAQAGDVGLLSWRGREAIAVCDGAQWLAQIEAENAHEMTPERLAAAEAAAAEAANGGDDVLKVVLDESASPTAGRRFTRA